MQPMPTENQPASDGPRVRLLAIDDDEQFLGIVRELLEPHGFEITVASNSVKALELYRVRGEQFDLVLLDFYMPGMDGGKTCEWLRKLNPLVKVVICSAADEIKLRQLRLQYAIDGCIHKPFRTEEAIHVIRRVLAQPPRAV
jgi:CheY-like chemotaxis protein